MRQGRQCVCWIVILAICIPTFSWCEETGGNITLQEVIVEGKQEKGVLEIKENQPNTESTINREGLRLYGGPGQVNSYQALDILPSVNFESADAYGLSFNYSIRVRGSTRVGVTTEGLGLLTNGLSGWNEAFLFDMENLSDISLYRGAVAPEKSLTPYNTGGTIDRTILRPSDKPGFTFNESHGSFNFNKVFARFDTGLLPTKTKIFASFSHTNADKWKGEGETKVDIFSFGVVQAFSPNVKAELFGTYSNPEAYAYRPLTYAQTKQLSAYYRNDYNSSLTGNNKEDINYYRYNKRTITSGAYFANVEVKVPGQGVVKVKPYYARENGSIYAGVANLGGAPGVRMMYIQPTMYGLGASYDTPFLGGTDLSLGYWYCNQEPPGPPTAYKRFRVNNNTLTYAGWQLLSNPVENHVWHSPYISLGKQFSSLYVKGGLRYVYEKVPSLDLYNSGIVPDVSYDDALGYGTVNAAGSVHGTIMREWLPNFGVNYAFSKKLNTYFNYGKNFGRSGFETWTAYNDNSTAFIKNGLSAQYVWSKIRPEISDNFDLGARYNSDMWRVAGALFYGMHNHKGVSVTDPNLGVKYTQNIAEATSYGAELEGSVDITKNLNVFATASYNRFQFTKDIRTATNAVTMAKGNQVPDVPVYAARIGATYRFFDNFSISPIVRYEGMRYGDVENKERVPSYTLVDADIRYTKENIWGFKSLSAGISFYNVFDTEYISLISVSDDTREGSASYYAGAPRTIIGRVEVKF